MKEWTDELLWVDFNQQTELPVTLPSHCYITIETETQPYSSLSKDKIKTEN